MGNLRVSHQTGDEIVCFCPLHEDDRPSLFINLQKNRIHCFAGCVKGTASAFLAKMGVRPEEIAEGGLAYIHEVVRQYSPTSSLEGKGAAYLIGRGFTPDTLRAWQIMCADTFVGIPVRRRNGELVGYIYRGLEGHAGYRNTPGLPRGKILFGTHMYEAGVNGGVYVVEGPLDCMWLWQNGVKNVVAAMGDAITERQSRLLRLLSSHVYLCFDNDAPGRGATRQAGGFLTQKGFDVKAVKFPVGYVDPQDIKDPELLLNTVKQGRVPYLSFLLQAG